MLVKIPVKRDFDVLVQGEGILRGKRYSNPPYVEIAGRRIYGNFYGYDEFASGWAMDIFGERYPLLLERGSFFLPELPREGEHIAINARRLNVVKDAIELQSDPEFGNLLVRFP
jgi:hypothetical protein